MNTQHERPPHTQLEPQYALHGVAQAAIQAPTAPSAADRLYQFAALTAGLFLLGTML